MAAISIGTWGDSEDVFQVSVDNYNIKTTVTSDPNVVTQWISEVQGYNRRNLRNLIVGLDIEWRPSYGPQQNPVATLQLCVGQHCLIYQLLYTPHFPQSLTNFLYNPDYTFVGVGIGEDVEKLLEFWEIGVQNQVDLARLGATYGYNRNAGLKELALNVIGLSIQKPRSVTMSRWDAEWLSYPQIQYAAIDAYVSYEIGRRLQASVNN